MLRSKSNKTMARVTGTLVIQQKHDGSAEKRISYSGPGECHRTEAGTTANRRGHAQRGQRHT